jgi:NADPH:quinone reductase-like Zn-dependent oxidoreductase
MLVNQEDILPMPSHMSYEEGATLPIACGTAWNSLYGTAKTIQSGDTVVCMGTGGVAVFTAAVSLADFESSHSARVSKLKFDLQNRSLWAPEPVLS